MDVSKIKAAYQRIKRRVIVNINEITIVYKQIAGCMLTALGAAAVFFDFKKVIPGIAEGILIIGILLAISLIPTIVYVVGKRYVEIDSFDGNKRLSVEFKDLFRSNSKIRVIGVNRCFDTITDRQLISKKSLHGQWLRSYLSNHSVEELDLEIDRQLRGKKYEEAARKQLGKKKRYPVGTVVEIRDGNYIYYLVGMTKLDERKLTASCTIEEYCLGILQLMKYYNEHGQQEDIALPLIGSGASRIPKKEEELLKCMLTLIKMGQNHGQGNIEILLKSDLREKICLYKLN